MNTSSNSSLLRIRIGRESCQPRVFYGTADREVVKVLVFAVSKAEDLVHRVVEVAADSSATDAGGFSFQIQDLADDARFPKEARIKPGAVKFQGFYILGNHTKAEATIAGNVLETANLPGGFPCVCFNQAIKLQLLRTPEGSSPGANLLMKRLEVGLESGSA